MIDWIKIEQKFRYTRAYEKFPLILLHSRMFDTTALFFTFLYYEWKIQNYNTKRKTTPLYFSSLSDLARTYNNKDRKTLKLMLKDLVEMQLISIEKNGQRIYININECEVLKLFDEYVKCGENTQKS